MRIRVKIRRWRGLDRIAHQWENRKRSGDLRDWEAAIQVSVVIIALYLGAFVGLRSYLKHVERVEQQRMTDQAFAEASGTGCGR